MGYAFFSFSGNNLTDYGDFMTQAKKHFYPFTQNEGFIIDGDIRYTDICYYDYTELFVYSVAPLLLFFLYKAFVEKKK
jgi:hypothetical protein